MVRKGLATQGHNEVQGKKQIRRKGKYIKDSKGEEQGLNGHNVKEEQSGGWKKATI